MNNSSSPPAFFLSFLIRILTGNFIYLLLLNQSPLSWEFCDVICLCFIHLSNADSIQGLICPVIEHATHTWGSSTKHLIEFSLTNDLSQSDAMFHPFSPDTFIVTTLLNLQICTPSAPPSATTQQKTLYSVWFLFSPRPEITSIFALSSLPLVASRTLPYSVFPSFYNIKEGSVNILQDLHYRILLLKISYCLPFFPEEPISGLHMDLVF